MTPELLTPVRMMYDWDKLFDGHKWEMVKGEDFVGHPLLVERNIRSKATRLGYKVTIKHPVDDRSEGPRWERLLVQASKSTHDVTKGDWDVV